jgi:hypothetical protein
MPPELPSPALTLNLPPDALRPLIRQVVEEVFAALEADRAKLGDSRLGWSEAEAARLLGLHQHQLRDERLRGRIKFSTIVGKRIRYTRGDLEAYLNARRDGAA